MLVESTGLLQADRTSFQILNRFDAAIWKSSGILLWTFGGGR
jgi:hypothetical protein